MICNVCGANPATIHLTEIINSQMLEIHLCEACAEEKGTDFKTHFNVADLLAGLGDVSASEAAAPKAEKLVCANCGLGYEEFTKNGRLGCASCYDAFSKYLNPLIKRVQRSSQHLGKRPQRIAPEDETRHELKLLQEKLKKAVAKEDFEEAAKLRDQIKGLQEKPKKVKKTKHEA
ncbi:MAG: UvrB/UvrC motif-containing protein [Candidatus Omnitrophica bacterium]|nr:UvrB/UvrC motif-containing protein [Candidatus Omnitrophota bacterium]